MKNESTGVRLMLIALGAMGLQVLVELILGWFDVSPPVAVTRWVHLVTALFSSGGLVIHWLVMRGKQQVAPDGVDGAVGVSATIGLAIHGAGWLLTGLSWAAVTLPSLVWLISAIGHTVVLSAVLATHARDARRHRFVEGYVAPEYHPNAVFRATAGAVLQVASLLGTYVAREYTTEHFQLLSLVSLASFIVYVLFMLSTRYREVSDWGSSGGSGSLGYLDQRTVLVNSKEYHDLIAKGYRPR